MSIISDFLHGITPKDRKEIELFREETQEYNQLVTKIAEQLVSLDITQIICAGIYNTICREGEAVTQTRSIWIKFYDYGIEIPSIYSTFDDPTFAWCFKYKEHGYANMDSLHQHAMHNVCYKYLQEVLSPEYTIDVGYCFKNKKVYDMYIRRGILSREEVTLKSW